MTLLFWLSAAFVIYVYAGYPLGIAACARLMKTRTRRPADVPAFEPGISIVIAAHDESARLPARIDNLLALDYPAAKRQIVVVSDGSTDGTAAVLSPYRAAVDLVELPHGGKAVALNAGVAHARHEIVVFADARQAFAPDTLRELVRPMADRAIGGVTGELLLDAEAELFNNRRSGHDRRRRTRAESERRRPLASTIGDGVGAYWRYEKAIRRSESAVASTLGATGAIYAIRRGLWSPLPVGTILDDVLTPMRIVLKGFRMVFNDRARAFDFAAADADGEARRKTRTLAGNYQLVALEPRLLLPWRNPVWLQFVSHKLARLAVPFALLAIFAASIALSAWPFYLAALLAQTGFYVLAGYGAWLERAARASQGTRPAMPAGVAAFGAREVA